MLNRVFGAARRGASVAKSGLKVGTLVAAVAVCSTGYIAYTGARDRVNEVVTPRVEVARDFTERTYDKAENYAEKGWGKLEENPIPVLVALVTMILTVVYHRTKGKTFRQALEVAVTKVNTVEVGERISGPSSAASRAQAALMYQQLERAQASFEGRLKHLPGTIDAGRKATNRAATEAQVAQKTADEKKLAFKQALDALAKLEAEQEAGQRELVEIDAELAALLPRI